MSAPIDATGLTRAKYLEKLLHHEDYYGAKFGMWLFLFTELLLFGGMFLVYATYYFLYSEDYISVSHRLNTTLGAVNTIVLLTSSLTMVLSITALQKNRKNLSMFYLAITILCALAFLVNKYFEWSAKFHHGIWPGSDIVTSLSHGETLFYGLYFVMTGLHGLHVVIGMVPLTVMLVWIYKGLQTPTNFVYLENSGLYWHLVDLIWIFLFPLFYLIGG